MPTMIRSLRPFLVLVALLSATSTSEASVTKKELLTTFDEVVARLPADKAAELGDARPKFEALDESTLQGGPQPMSALPLASSSSQSQMTGLSDTRDSGTLDAEPVGALNCPARDLLFVKGDQVRVSGSGFAPGADIEIELTTGKIEEVVATIAADGDGKLDGVITLPTGETPEYPAHTAAVIDAVGPSPTGVLWLNVLIEIATPSGDADGDGIPDYCDMCPGLSATNNTDSDGDRVGDACDPCPNGKDSDGDGQCDDVDPCKFDPLNDEDGDGVCGNEDNCPQEINPDQADSDENGIGDECQTESSCRDGIDNDGDGYIDARVVGGDPGCASPEGLSGNPQCSDGIDNDGDGRYDADGYFGVYGLD